MKIIGQASPKFTPKLSCCGSFRLDIGYNAFTSRIGLVQYIPVRRRDVPLLILGPIRHRTIITWSVSILTTYNINSIFFVENN